MDVLSRPNLSASQSGQALIQVLIASAVMGIVIFAMSTMMANQAKENRATEEKIGAADLSRGIVSALQNQATCDAIVNSSNTLNSSTFTFATAGPFPVLKLTALPVLNATAGKSASAISSTLNLLPSNSTPAGIELVINSPTNATLNVNFDQSKLVRPIHNLSFPMVPLATTSSGPNSTVTGCLLSSATQCQGQPVPAPPVFNGSGQPVFSPEDQKALAGGVASYSSLVASIPTANGGNTFPPGTCVLKGQQCNATQTNGQGQSSKPNCWTVGTIGYTWFCTPVGWLCLPFHP